MASNVEKLYGFLSGSKKKKKGVGAKRKVPISNKVKIEKPDMGSSPGYGSAAMNLQNAIAPSGQTQGEMQLEAADRLAASMGPSQAYEPSSFFGIADTLAATTEEGGGAHLAVDKEQKDAASELTDLMAARAKSSGKGKAISPLDNRQLNKTYNAVISMKEGTPALIEYFGQGKTWTPLGSRKYKEIKEAVKTFFGLSDKGRIAAAQPYWRTVNNYIKAITGAQMSEIEVKRLMRALPDLNQGPEAFFQAWDAIIKETERNYINNVKSFRDSGYKYIDSHIERATKFSDNPYESTKFKTVGGGKSTGTITGADEKFLKDNEADKDYQAWKKAKGN